VFAHNVETVRRLTRTVRDVRCGYDLSLSVLSAAHATPGTHLVKSSIMLGLGETDDEVIETMGDLRAAGCALLTLGQYLRPSQKHHAVKRWVPPETFDRLAAIGRELGYRNVASGPLVRSSYRAGEHFVGEALKETGSR